MSAAGRGKSPAVVRLTVAERATLSNTICGELECASSLERMGLLKIKRVATSARGQLAFFDLTDVGEAYVARHFAVADSSEPSAVSGES